MYTVIETISHFNCKKNPVKSLYIWGHYITLTFKSRHGLIAAVVQTETSNSSSGLRLLLIADQACNCSEAYQHLFFY